MSLSIKIKYIKKLSDEIDFGKYKGMLVSDVLDENPKYLWWLMKNTNKTEFSSKLKEKITNTIFDEDDGKFGDTGYVGDDFWKD